MNKRERAMNTTYIIRKVSSGYAIFKFVNYDPRVCYTEAYDFNSEGDAFVVKKLLERLYDRDKIDEILRKSGIHFVWA